MTPAASPAVVCAENIALLHALGEVPAAPSRNDVDPKLRRADGDSALSFDQERKLVSALAYVASHSDGPDYVSAVCVEEDAAGAEGAERADGPVRCDRCDGRVLRVLLAMNRASWSGRQAALETQKRGLESMLAPLARVGVAADDVKGAVFAAVVAARRERILVRLRLAKSARRPQQPTFEAHLRQAVQALEARRAPSGVIHAAKDVLRLVDVWRQYQTLAPLQALVDGVCRLRETAAFDAAIHALPNTLVDPDTRRCLLNIVHKVARYREVARVLYHTAKAVPAVRCMAVVIVQLPPAAFDRPSPGSPDGYVPDMAAALARVCGRAALPLGKFCRLSHRSKAEYVTTFKEQVHKTLSDAKVHAEVQLLIHCMQRAAAAGPQYRPPRAVRSHKDACFLCNAYLQMHSTTMYVAKHHGRLYPGWRLPASVSAAVQTRFNEVLAKQIRTTIAARQTRYMEHPLPLPWESTLTSLPSLASTSASTATSTATSSSSSLSVVLIQDADHADADNAVDVVDVVDDADVVNAVGDANDTNNETAVDVADDIDLTAPAPPAVTNHDVTAQQVAEIGCPEVLTQAGNVSETTQSRSVSQARQRRRLHAGRLPDDTNDERDESDESDESNETATICPAAVASVDNDDDDDDDDDVGSTQDDTRSPPWSWSARVRHGTTTPLLAVPPFELQIAYASAASGDIGTGTGTGADRRAGPRSPSSPSPPLAIGVCVEYLTRREAATLHRRSSAVTVVEADALPPGCDTTLALDGRGCLYLTSHSRVVKLSLRFVSEAAPSS